MLEGPIRTIQELRCLHLKRCINREAGNVWESTQKLAGPRWEKSNICLTHSDICKNNQEAPCISAMSIQFSLWEEMQSTQAEIITLLRYLFKIIFRKNLIAIFLLENGFFLGPVRSCFTVWKVNGAGFFWRKGKSSVSGQPSLKTKIPYSTQGYISEPELLGGAPKKVWDVQ